MHDFALEPRRFASNERILSWKFDVSEQDAARRPLRVQPTVINEPASLQVEQGTKIFRIRCVQGSLPTEADWRNWPTKGTYWPSDVYVECNGEMLEERRKLGHGKDLPIDVTRFIKAGSNEIRMISNMDSKAPVTGFSVAVEVVVVQTFEKIKQDCTQRVFPQEETRKALASGMQSEDDDLQLTFATIGLRDPMLGSRIWDTPTRGSNCRHREAGDLEIIMVDQWMLDVRKELESTGRLDARSISVEAHGSWTVFEEKRDDRSASRRKTSRESESLKSPDGTHATPTIGVIEIDGDEG